MSAAPPSQDAASLPNKTSADVERRVHLYHLAEKSSRLSASVFLSWCRRKVPIYPIHTLTLW